MSCYGILTVRRPVRKQTLCLDYQHDVFLNVHNSLFFFCWRDVHNDLLLFSRKMTVLHAEYLMDELYLKTTT
jgi:hypothetical protein